MGDTGSPAPPPGRSLPQAIATALVLIAAIVVCYMLGRAAFFVLICIVVLAALFEALDALAQSGRRPVMVIGLGGGAALLGLAYRERLDLVGLALAVTLLAAFVAALRPGRGETPATDVGATLLAVAWVAGGGAGATAIMMLDPGGLALLVAFIFIAALDDIGAYFAGTTFGRHKMAPSISPAKSWEGFAGGIVLALAGGAAFGAALDELTVAHGLALGGICGLLVPAGDLVESMFKREMGIKDSGRLLPGHGGFLDRLDAILFVAPVAYLYLRVVVYG